MTTRRDSFNEHLPLMSRLLEVPSAVPRVVWYGRLALLLAMVAWGTSVLLAKLTEFPTVLHLTVILFHEAGHVLFAPFGDALRVAGGSLGQLLMPAVCVVALHRRCDNFGAAIALAWMSMSLIDTAVYAYDADDPQLPLIGGGTGADRFHDFIFLFDRYGQLDHARAWARAMKGVGAAGLLTAWTWAGTVLLRQSGNLVE